MARDLNQLLRPASWDAVVGQEDTKEIILKAIEHGTFPNFSIFCGPTGVGKSCMAELTAKTLLCTGEDKPCGNCAGCKTAEHSIVKHNMAAMIGKKDIIQVLDGIFKYEGLYGKTVYILEEVQVLKQKEEQTPFLEELTKIPDDVYVMMCTTRVTSLLPAMRNRATIFQLTVPSTEECVGLIQSTLERMNIQPMSYASMTSLANLSDNTPRNIIKHIGLLSSEGSITDVTMSKFFKTVSREQYIECLRQLVAPDINIYSFIKYLKTFDGKSAYTALIYGLKDFVLTALIEVSIGVPEPTLSVTDREYMGKVMQLVSEKDFLRLVERIGDLKGDDISDDKAAMYSLITLKMKTLNVTPVTAIQNDKQAAGAARATSIRQSRVFTEAPAGIEPVTTDLSDDAIESITGIRGGETFVE